MQHRSFGFQQLFPNPHHFLPVLSQPHSYTLGSLSACAHPSIGTFSRNQPGTQVTNCLLCCPPPDHWSSHHLRPYSRSTAPLGTPSITSLSGTNRFSCTAASYLADLAASHALGPAGVRARGPVMESSGCVCWEALAACSGRRRGAKHCAGKYALESREYQTKGYRPWRVARCKTSLLGKKNEASDPTHICTLTHTPKFPKARFTYVSRHIPTLHALDSRPPARCNRSGADGRLGFVCRAHTQLINSR